MSANICQQINVLINIHTYLTLTVQLSTIQNIRLELHSLLLISAMKSFWLFCCFCFLSFNFAFPVRELHQSKKLNLLNFSTLTFNLCTAETSTTATAPADDDTPIITNNILRAPNLCRGEKQKFVVNAHGGRCRTIV